MELEVNVADLIARLEEKGVRIQTVGRKTWVPREQWGKLTPEERRVCSDHNVRERMAVELGRRMATPHQASLTRVPSDSDEDNATVADIKGQDPSTVYAGKLIDNGEWLVWGMRWPDDKQHEVIWRWQLENAPTNRDPWPWRLLGRQPTEERAELVRIHFANRFDKDGFDYWCPLVVRQESEGVPPLPDDLTEPPPHLTDLYSLIRSVVAAELTRRDRE